MIDAAHSPSVDSHTTLSDFQARLLMVMGAIEESHLTLGELLVGLFTPTAFDTPASRGYDQLVRAFLRGQQPVRMADVLDCLLAHPAAQPPDATQMFSPSIPYRKLLAARAVLTSWAAQACPDRPSAAASAAKYKPGKDQRLQLQPLPPPSRLLPLPPVPETPTMSSPVTTLGSSTIVAGAATFLASPNAPKGTILSVALTTEERTVPVSLSSSQPVDRGASASIWQGLMLDEPNETVALKVFRPTTSPETSHEIVDREIQAWRRLNHPRLLRLVGTSSWDSQTVLVSPYMGNGNMLQYLQLNTDLNPLGLIIQVAEGLRYLHTQAGVVHGDLKCQNVLIADNDDAVLADFGLSTLIDKLESDSTTGSVIRWQGTLRFSAPELLGSLADEDRGKMRSKTVKTDIYAFGMLALQAFTGTAPWRGISEMKVIEHILSGLNPPHPGTLGRGRGLDDGIWMICLWCWQFKPIDRPPIDLIYQALALRHRNDTSPAGIVEWLESLEFKRQHWKWLVLNGLLDVVISPRVSDALTNESMANILWAIVNIDSIDIAELRVALKRFLSLLRINDQCSLRLLSAEHGPSLWTRLHSTAYLYAPEEVLDVMCILGSVLIRLQHGLQSSAVGRIEAPGQWDSIHSAISTFLERSIGDLIESLTSLGDLDVVLRCDKRLHTLMHVIARLSPSRWTSLRASLFASAKKLPATRGIGYLRHLEHLGRHCCPHSRKRGSSATSCQISR